MRIAFIVGQFPCVSETFIAAQIAGLRSRGHSVDVYADEAGPPTTHVGGDVDPTLAPLRILHPVRMVAAMKAGEWSVALPAIFRFIRAYGSYVPRFGLRKYGRTALLTAARYAAACHETADYDVIHAHFGPHGVKAAALRDAGLLSGQLVVSFHGYDLSSHLRVAGRDTYSALFREAALCLPVTNRWARRLLELGCSAEKVEVHRMGVDVDTMPVPERHSTGSGVVELVTVARLVDKKGIECALRAVAGLTAEFRYTIIGDGPDYERLSDLVHELAIGERVRLLGSLSHSQVLHHLQQSDIAILPSQTAANGDEEGLPVALMEAMAAGLPVVSTWHSGIPELVTDGVEGFLAPERDVDELRRCIDRLITQPHTRIEMGHAARERVKLQHDQRQLNEQLIGLYRTLTDHGRQRALELVAKEVPLGRVPNNPLPPDYYAP